MGKEKNALEEAHESVRNEKKALKKAGQELKEAEKRIEEFNKKFGKVENFKEALKKKIAQRTEKLTQRLANLEKFGRILAERTGKWLERKAERWVGTRLALKAAEIVAEVILRAIPVIGEILLLVDAVMLIWDVGSALWDILSDWWSEKERKAGDGDGTGDGIKDDQGVEGDHANLPPGDTPKQGGGDPPDQFEKPDDIPGSDTSKNIPGSNVGGPPGTPGGHDKTGKGSGTEKTGSKDAPKADVKGREVAVHVGPDKKVSPTEQVMHQLESDPTVKLDPSKLKSHSFSCHIYLKNAGKEIRLDSDYDARIVMNIAMPAGSYLSTANVSVRISRYQNGKVYFTLPKAAPMVSEDKAHTFVLDPTVTYPAEYKGSY
jgi:hypothetical protein